ncbi:hypothetical protein KCU65_g468, partial [Aureobasidium melanogenum]
MLITLRVRLRPLVRPLTCSKATSVSAEFFVFGVLITLVLACSSTQLPVTRQTAATSIGLDQQVIRLLPIEIAKDGVIFKLKLKREDAPTMRQGSGDLYSACDALFTEDDRLRHFGNDLVLPKRKMKLSCCDNSYMVSSNRLGKEHRDWRLHLSSLPTSSRAYQVLRCCYPSQSIYPQLPVCHLSRPSSPFGASNKFFDLNVALTPALKSLTSSNAAMGSFARLAPFLVDRCDVDAGGFDDSRLMLRRMFLTTPVVAAGEVKRRHHESVAGISSLLKLSMNDFDARFVKTLILVHSGRQQLPSCYNERCGRTVSENTRHHSCDVQQITPCLQTVRNTTTKKYWPQEPSTDLSMRAAMSTETFIQPGVFIDEMTHASSIKGTSMPNPHPTEVCEEVSIDHIIDYLAFTTKAINNIYVPLELRNTHDFAVDPSPPREIEGSLRRHHPGLPHPGYKGTAGRRPHHSHCSAQGHSGRDRHVSKHCGPTNLTALAAFTISNVDKKTLYKAMGIKGKVRSDFRLDYLDTPTKSTNVGDLQHFTLQSLTLVTGSTNSLILTEAEEARSPSLPSQRWPA